jgi:hypothetical protein
MEKARNSQQGQVQCGSTYDYLKWQLLDLEISMTAS